MNIKDARRILIQADITLDNMTDQEILDQASLRSTDASPAQAEPVVIIADDTTDLIDIFMNDGKKAFKLALDQHVASLTPEPAQPITTTITVVVDEHGNPVIPDVTVQSQPEKSVHDIFNFVGNYTFPMADYEHQTAEPFYDFEQMYKTSALARVASAMKRGKHVCLYGPKGTGKTLFVEALSHRLNMPCTRISHSQFTDAMELQGGTGMQDGKTYWKDGALTQAIRIPFNNILLDEYSKSLPAMDEYQTLLDHGYITLTTGEIVHVAEGVTFFAADNHDGTGDQTSLYVGTSAVNSAFSDRFMYKIEVDYMTVAQETRLLSNHVDQHIAKQLADFAAMTRQAVKSGEIEEPISYRRLEAIAMAVADGIPKNIALESCLYSYITHPDDREYYRTSANAHLSI